MNWKLVSGFLSLAMGAGLIWFIANRYDEDREQSPKVLAGPLNPNAFPSIPRCEKISLEDPVEEARRNIRKDDRRPFTVYGFTNGDVPGVFCPSGNYIMESRGGAMVSDVPEVCGENFSFSNADDNTMKAYNRELASDPRFQEITQCRPATYCEERHQKFGSGAVERDPQCPGEIAVFLSVAANGTQTALKAILEEFADTSPKTRDLKTSALLRALGRAKWENAEILLQAGADVNGRAFDSYPDEREWLDAPLAQVFNQLQDGDAAIERARWLMSKGADFRNPNSSNALLWAASTNNSEAIDFLLAAGARANGNVSEAELDRMATADIRTAGGMSRSTPFYAALSEATKRWGRRTSEEIGHADTENRKGRENAIRLLEAGGRFQTSVIYPRFRQDPDIKAMSIILAAAHREGRTKELVERMLYPNGKDRPTSPEDASGELREFLEYLEKVQACFEIEPKSMGDFIELCPSDAV